MVNIRLENIQKKFDDVVALKDVNFDIKDGEFFILLGASGPEKVLH
jgi:ABC-type sugar transport systems, ATPase components